MEEDMEQWTCQLNLSVDFRCVCRNKTRQGTRTTTNASDNRPPTLAGHSHSHSHSHSHALGMPANILDNTAIQCKQSPARLFPPFGHVNQLMKLSTGHNSRGKGLWTPDRKGKGKEAEGIFSQEMVALSSCLSLFHSSACTDKNNL